MDFPPDSPNSESSGGEESLHNSNSQSLDQEYFDNGNPKSMDPFNVYRRSLRAKKKVAKQPDEGRLNALTDFAKTQSSDTRLWNLQQLK